jgi:hypothetical protein
MTAGNINTAHATSKTGFLTTNGKAKTAAKIAVNIENGIEKSRVKSLTCLDNRTPTRKQNVTLAAPPTKLIAERPDPSSRSPF